MKRNFIACAMLGAVGVFAGLALAADVAPGKGQGWTGVTNPQDVIHARQELMGHIEELMEPIDTITLKGKPVTNPDALRESAGVIGAMLLSLPHLFPPTTNRYDPKVEQPETLALPGIWKDFPTFYKLAAAASTTAEAMTEVKGTRAAAHREPQATCELRCVPHAVSAAVCAAEGAALRRELRFRVGDREEVDARLESLPCPLQTPT